MAIIPSRDLPPLFDANGWKWKAPSDPREFWVGVDADDRYWLVKFRGGFDAMRERAFSVIAQALDISCQSSTYLKMPRGKTPVGFPQYKTDYRDVHQLAIWHFDEHQSSEACGDDCSVREFNEQWQKRPYDVDVLNASRIRYAIDMARGAMLGMLCEMFEPPGRLITRDHTFVQIDNEKMFADHAGAYLRESVWVVGDSGRIKPSGLQEAVLLCKKVLDLPQEVFEEALRLPTGYKPQMLWSLRKQISAIQPRADKFLSWASSPRL